jgi:hypothetical protein
VRFQILTAAMIMETVRTSETSIYSKETIRRFVPEVSNPQLDILFNERLFSLYYLKIQ